MLPAVRKKASEKSLQAIKQTSYDDENPETEHNHHQG